ncbi:hypothetical protein HDU97_003237 [Phlyctochytrium planicorne]|nr:hypothetical protein HDU97_003237 [Phlyctochytrium planicorne]
MIKSAVTFTLLTKFNRFSYGLPPSVHVLILQTITNKPWSPRRHLDNPILILDSSFNPPTLGHHHLILKSLTDGLDEEHYFPFDTVILMHAVSNEDKPSSFGDLERRLELMEAAGKDLANAIRRMKQIDVEIVLGVTSAGRFVDKAVALKKVVGGRECHWIMGYDTVTRLFDPKYYPVKPSSAPPPPPPSPSPTPPTAATRAAAKNEGEEQDPVMLALAPMFKDTRGHLILFDRVHTSAGQQTLDTFLSQNPTARRLVRMKRINIVKDWNNYEVTVGGDHPSSFGSDETKVKKLIMVTKSVSADIPSNRLSSIQRLVEWGSKNGDGGYIFCNFIKSKSHPVWEAVKAFLEARHKEFGGEPIAAPIVLFPTTQEGDRVQIYVSVVPASWKHRSQREKYLFYIKLSPCGSSNESNLISALQRPPNPIKTFRPALLSSTEVRNYVVRFERSTATDAYSCGKKECALCVGMAGAAEFEIERRLPWLIDMVGKNVADLIIRDGLYMKKPEYS